LTNDKLAEEAIKMFGSQPATCDSAEPKSIAELQRYKVDARPAAKGKDSVLHGIQWLQQQTIIVDTKCINMRNELQGYKWKEDKGGNALPVPVDSDNHLVDALRYAYEQDMLETWLW
jgi:phage terminase large subunit